MILNINYLKKIYLNKSSVVAMAGAALLLVSADFAAAQLSVISGAVNLRNGPGTRYSRIATLPRGAAVHIDHCGAGWCQIKSSWGIGWVSARYLQAATGAYANPPPQIGFGLNIDSDDWPGYWDNGPFYRPYRWPYYRPPYWPGYRPDLRPHPYPHWNPRWGIGPVRPPYLQGSGRGRWR